MKKLFIILLSLLSFGAMAQHGNFTDIRLINGSAGLAGTNNGTIYFNPGSGLFQFRQGGAWLGLGGTYTGSNGITLTGSNFTLGGTLAGNTAINGNSLYQFNVTSTTASTLSTIGLLDFVSTTNKISLSGNTGVDINSFAVSGVKIFDGTTYGTIGQFLKHDGTGVVWGSGGSISGSGTTNELAYWTSSTALGALAVATYPSLTELSKVKGVTGADIQTQINAKGVGDMVLASTQTSTGKKTFQPDATNAGVNVGSLAGNPSASANGDIWRNSTTSTLRTKINGSDVDILTGQLNNTRIPFLSGSNSTLEDDPDLTFTLGNLLTTANATVTTALKNTALTSGRVPYITTGGQFTDNTNLTIDLPNNGIVVGGNTDGVWVYADQTNHVSWVVGLSSTLTSFQGVGTTAFTSGGGEVQIYGNGSNPVKIGGTGNSKLRVTSGITSDEGFQHKRVTTGSVSAGATTTVTVTWDVAFDDTNYTVSHSIESVYVLGQGVKINGITSKTTTTTVFSVTNDYSGSETGTINAIAIHD